MPWAVKWRDSDGEYLIGRFGLSVKKAPVHLAGYETIVFETREEARLYVRAHYGYLSKDYLWNKSLQRKTPQVVKVTVKVEEVS